MAIWKSERTAHGLAIHPPGHELDLPVLAASVATLGLLIVWLVPLPLVMPVLSVVAFAIAGIVALYAYYTRASRNADRMTSWDVAGVFALVWLGAGLASDPEHIVKLFDHLMTQ